MHPTGAAPERDRRRIPRASGRPARPTAHRLTVAAAAFWMALVLAVFPVVHDGARAIDDGWRPVGDEAFVAMAVHDVFTTHTPLIGMPARGLESPGSPYHHLGPLEFWLLAVPYRLTGASAAGIVVGVALVAVATVVALGLVARRLGGNLFAVTALLVTTWLLWALGAQVAHSPLNPSIALLPLALLVLLGAAVARGDLALMPGLAFVASFVAQAHLSTLAVTAAVVVACGIPAGLTLRRLGREGQGDTVRRTAALTAGVLAFCWSAPVLEQLAAGNWNLAAALNNLRQPADEVGGVDFGLDLVAEVAGLPPPLGLLVPVDARFGLPGGVGIGTALRVLVAGAAAVGLLVHYHRRGARLQTRTMATATAALVAATITVSNAPFVPGLDVVNGWNVWLLWPIAAAFWLLVLLAVAEAGLRHSDRSRWLPVALVAVLVASLLAATVERDYADPDHEPRSKVIGQIADRLEEALPRGAYRLVLGGTGVLVKRDPHVVASGLVAELERRGYDLFVTARSPAVTEALAEHRRYADQPVRGTLLLTGGHRPLERYPTPRVLVRTGLLDPGQRSELRAIEEQLRRAIERDGPLRLTPEGRRIWRFEAKYTAALTIDRYLDVDTRLLEGSLADLYRDGSVVRPALDRKLLERQAELVGEDFRLLVSYLPGDPT